MSADLAVVAGIAHRLAVLLGAGVAPGSAWLHVADASESPVPAAVLEAAGHDIPGAIHAAAARRPALEAEAWRGLAAAWAVATEAGAPLAPSLRAYAASLRSLGQAQRDALAALAGPVATARMVLALPAIGLLFGLAMGFDVIGVLLGRPIGWACLAIGGALILVAVRWNRRLLARAQPGGATPGIECDLMAIAVSGGSALPRARAQLAAVAERFGVSISLTRVDGVLELSRRAGVPAGELLRSEAEDARGAARADAQARAARLSVRLMLPLGLCVLPAFMVLGVLPLIVSVVSSTVGGF